ncbi:MAG: hypothetical protein IT443_03165 [Phycisphaeraceae bacterium]|nr:hypothetical protein [Phycisphaeraceae bacterium]
MRLNRRAPSATWRSGVVPPGACARLALLILLCLGTYAQGRLSTNVVQGGDFESLSYLKLQDSPLTAEEILAGAEPIRAWQFHPGGIDAVTQQPFTDVGMWIGAFGLSTEPDPRQAWNEQRDISPINRSTVMRNGQPTGVLEGVTFRSWTTQIIQGPENQIPGQASIDFDYFWNNWVPAYTQDGASIFHVWIGGFNQADIPSWEDRTGPLWGGDPEWGDAEDPSFGTPLWTSPNWDEWGWFGEGSEEPDVPSLGNQWNTLSVTDPDRTTFMISAPFDYYYISVWEVVYSENHPYFYQFGGQPADTLAVAIDNIVLRLPVAIKGDFNGDGVVTLSDINPFKLALTDPVAWQAAFPDVVLLEVDPSGDGYITLSDINLFKALLTGGAGSPVPEPSCAALLALGVLALNRRQR